MDKHIFKKHLSCAVKYLVGQVGHGISTGLNCYIIVFSLVDFKPGGCGFKSGLCNFLFFLLFFFFFFFEYIESVFGSNIAPPPPPPPQHFFYFLNIVQYLFVPCTIPSTLGSYPPYPTSPPTPHSAFTSTLTPPPNQPDPPAPPPPLPFFLCEFSQK